MKHDESTQETEEGHKVNKWWQKQKIQEKKYRNQKSDLTKREVIQEV